METMEAVLEQPQSTGSDVAQGSTQESSQPSEQDQRRQEDREYSAWLKSLRDDPDAGKHYRRIKDDSRRMMALSGIEPRGIDGVREKYSTINGIAYGEAKGLDAVNAMQGALAESQTVLDGLAQGNMEALNEEQQEGLLRMTPALLDRLAESSPEEYASAVLPHFVEALRGSDLSTAYAGIVEALSEKAPTWLREDQKAQWTNERLQRVIQHVTRMGQWFQAQEERVQKLGADGGKAASGRLAQAAESKPSEGYANPDFWSQQIFPETEKHASQTFAKDLRPWTEKLAKAGIKLSADKQKAMLAEVIGITTREAQKNQSFQAQMARYNRQRTPDTASVLSTFKAEFNKHSARVLESLMRRDYGQILDKRTAPRQEARKEAKSPPQAPQNGVRYVSVKPPSDKIDFPKTPESWIFAKKWRMKDGSVVQLRS